MNENPFTPAFGEEPLVMAGRHHVIGDISRALESANRRPELTTLFSGARGTGKTTLLASVAAQAERSGWVTVNVTCLAGMLDDIEIGLQRSAAHLVDVASTVNVSSVGVPQMIEVKFDRQEPAATNWRWRMADLLDQLGEAGIGVLITVDEIDPTLDEMITLAAVYQHFIREGRKVALMMAGLPHSVSALLSDKTVSFLRRARQVELGSIPDYEIEAAFAKTVREGGRDIASADLAKAVAAIEGFPFLMQLVGYRAWDENPGDAMVSASDVEAGIRLARAEMETSILDATFRELSEGDIKFIEAMLEDEGSSSISVIEKRLGWSASQTGQYATRLAKAGVIGRTSRGVVAFELPFFREFMEEKRRFA